MRYGGRCHLCFGWAAVNETRVELFGEQSEEKVAPMRGGEGGELNGPS